MSRSRVRAPQRSVRTRPRLALDRLAGGQQRARLQGGLEQHHLIEVGGLIHPGERLGLLHGRTPRPGGCRGARRAPRGRRRDARRGRPDCFRARRTPAPVGPPSLRSRPRNAARSAGGRVATSPSCRMARSSSACPAAASSARCASSSVSVRVRAEPAATRSICSLNPLDRAELLRGGGGDGLGVAAGLAGGADDRVERLRRVGAQLLHARHRLPPPLHLVRDRRDLGADLLQQSARLPRRMEALGRQVPHLVGHHREAAALAPGPRRLDRRVERDEVGEIGDLADGPDEAADPGGERAQLGHLLHAARHEPLQPDQPLDRLADHHPVPARHFRGGAAGLGGLRALGRHRPGGGGEGVGGAEPAGDEPLEVAPCPAASRGRPPRGPRPSPEATRSPGPARPPALRSGPPC